LTFIELPPGTYTITTTAFAFACQPVSAIVQSLETTTVTVTCTRTTGTVAGVVTSGGSPIQAAIVELRAPATPGIVQTRTTGTDGTFTFGALAGEYVVTAVHQHHNCPTQSAIVHPEQTTTADLSCTPKTTGLIEGIVAFFDDHGGSGPLGFVDVNLTGPVTRTTTSGTVGTFRFDELPPGTYTATMAAVGLDCSPAIAEVQAAQTTTIVIGCTFRPPFGSEIAGNWVYNRFVRSQTGSCPAPLPDQGTGSMTFNPVNNAIAIVGLDPELTIAGVYDEESGSYTGTGTAVLSDGSSIQTDVELFFGFDFFDFDGVVFFTEALPSHVWTRRHRGPGGNLVCTEVYGASGFRLN
jgi:hypothetical protein